MYSKIALTLIVMASAGIGAAVAQTTPSPAIDKPPAAMPNAPPMVVAPPMATTTAPMAPMSAPMSSSTASTTAPSAIATSTTPVPAGAPVAGANSFTEGQARSRIEGQGFTDVANLAKDDQSIWRGTAMKSGVSTRVALDYQGNIVAH